MRVFREYSISFSLLLSLILLVQTFPMSLYALDYYLDVEKYIAYCMPDGMDTHCDETCSMDHHDGGECDGTCQLDKKMKDVDGDHQHSANNERATLVYLAEDIFDFQSDSVLIKNRIKTSYHTRLHPQSVINSLLRPPRSLA